MGISPGCNFQNDHCYYHHSYNVHIVSASSMWHWKIYSFAFPSLIFLPSFLKELVLSMDFLTHFPSIYMVFLYASSRTLTSNRITSFLVRLNNSLMYFIITFLLDLLIPSWMYFILNSIVFS